MAGERKVGTAHFAGMVAAARARETEATARAAARETAARIGAAGKAQGTAAVQYTTEAAADAASRGDSAAMAEWEVDYEAGAEDAVEPEDGL